MSEEQRILPGFEDLLSKDHAPYLVMLYAGHVALRQSLAELFDSEIAILRRLAQLNERQCPQSIYSGQRELCMAIKEVVVCLDNVNDTNGEIFHAR